jgi:hypothetical protein
MITKAKRKTRSLIDTLKACSLRRYLLIGFILFMTPLTISYGGSKAGFTVKNKTDYYLHVYVNGEPHLYLAPMRSASASSTSTTFSVTAFYAPGQGVSGIIDRSFEADYTPSSSSSSGCNDSSDYGPSCECEKSTTPADYGSITWDITADTMLVAE